ncbi:hypothetical protein HDE71_001421 [Janthinobacterium sp. S3M3]|nr:hypothetical protein [Janthinobacterium sp. S3T4]MBB5612420.1 hypothetical protein [Janthinobacterium sp. S3M3]
MHQQASLTGKTVGLIPLSVDHALQLLQAAADGELWAMTVTVVPGLATMDQYIATALEDRPDQPQDGNRPHLAQRLGAAFQCQHGSEIIAADARI